MVQDFEKKLYDWDNLSPEEKKEIGDEVNYGGFTEPEEPKNNYDPEPNKNYDN